MEYIIINGIEDVLRSFCQKIPLSSFHACNNFLGSVTTNIRFNQRKRAIIYSIMNHGMRFGDDRVMISFVQFGKNI